MITIISLSITGYYMHGPYVVARGHTGYVMGTMRFVHLVSVSLFLGAVLIRMYWFLSPTVGRAGINTFRPPKSASQI